MRIEKPVVLGRLVRRYKRFLADVKLDGKRGVVTAHCPNTGGLLGCQEPGSRVVLRVSQDPGRKLRYTWQAVEVDGTWVNVDTALPNAVVAEAVRAGAVPALRGYPELRREVPYGSRSRIDLLLERGEERRYVEVKCTTLARGRTALFPDAVTARGLKHLGELEAVVRGGHRAVQFFFISRGDATRFRPAADIDPAYAEGLRRAAEAGVEVVAYSARVAPDRLELDRRLRVAS